MIGRFSHLGSYKELRNFNDFIRAAAGGLLALAGYFLAGTDTPETFAGILTLGGSVAINGLPIIWGAFQGVRRREVNVDELVSLAIVASLAAGELLSAAVVSFVMVMGTLIEGATSESARKAIRELIQVAPQHATVLENGSPIVKTVASIKVGDIIVVKPGERIPVDARIVSGSTAIDEASITGESIPVEKQTGNTVYSGTLNLTGVLQVEATKVGEDTTLGKIIKLVAEAEAHRPQSVSIIERYARWFTPAILACAALALVVTGDPRRAITVLIVGCPCALILAAPTAIVATISRAAKAGILIKGGIFLEKAAIADSVLFDKTGTLTEGEPKVEQVVPATGFEPSYVLQQAACVEQDSTHPLARAVLKAACYARITVQAAEDLMTVIGLGIKGCVAGCMVEVGSAYFGVNGFSLPPPLDKCLEEIKEKGATPLVVYQNKKPLGVISVADQIRPGASGTVRQLKQLGIKCIGILSGDHEASVQLIRERAGITVSWAGLKPDGKLNVIKKLRSEGRKILFVGDGINDAPALAVADVGIAMGAKGTDVALETADIALMNDDIVRLPFLIQISRRMVKVIKWNIAFGIAFNLISVLLGAGGYLSPIGGALVHNIGSVLVVFSSASLGFFRPAEH